MRGTEWRMTAVMVIVLGAGEVIPAAAQLNPSEKFSLIQVVDGDTIAITGSRPNRRGREIYGKQVAWDKQWTPGANNSTTFSVGRDFQIDGVPVPAGKYSVWMVPRANDQWSLVLNPNAELFHTAHPDSAAGQLHFPLTALTIDPVETLTWSINDMRGWRGTVRMAWADKSVEFGIKLNSNVVLAVDAEVAAKVAGEYLVASTEGGEPVPAERIVVWREGELLAWKFAGGQAEAWADGNTWVLLPRGADTFAWGMVYEGELVGLIEFALIEWASEPGKAPRLEFRQVPNDKLWIAADRKP
jgi:hypothetical protein